MAWNDVLGSLGLSKHVLDRRAIEEVGDWHAFATERREGFTADEEMNTVDGRELGGGIDDLGEHEGNGRTALDGGYLG